MKRKTNHSGTGRMKRAAAIGLAAAMITCAPVSSFADTEASRSETESMKEASPSAASLPAKAESKSTSAESRAESRENKTESRAESKAESRAESAASSTAATPTKAPTAKPTAVPTETPQNAPTAPAATPTETLAANPTAAPTEAPAAPTAAPTKVPTAAPTTTPEATPTTAPTAKPTAAPQAKPTAVPTAAPTATPAAKPTTAPKRTVPSLSGSTGTGSGLLSGESGYGYTAWLSSLTPAQKLRTKMTSADEAAYALCKADGTKVYAKKKDTATVIGTMERGVLGRVLEDKGDGWVYIESGDVRGFCKADAVRTGSGVDTVVKETGAGRMPAAKTTVSPAKNPAFSYLTVTTEEIPTFSSSAFSYYSGMTTATRAEIVAYAEQFLGNPYVWGGTSLTNGTDCSGFTQGVYAHFGISLPRCSYEQCNTGTRIRAEDAEPGDLLFYAHEDGTVYHVLIYIGDGKAINAKGAAYGIVISDVNYSQVCWGTRYINDANGGAQVALGRTDPTNYTQKQLELIWAIVGQEDSESYEGALAVITSAMNRADRNYGGHGTDALSQLTAPGQYCFSPSVSDPSYYQARLNGNVADYVKQAVSDCLTKGYRNHTYLNFRSRNSTGHSVQIGGNWYY